MFHKALTYTYVETFHHLFNNETRDISNIYNETRDISNFFYFFLGWVDNDIWKLNGCASKSLIAKSPKINFLKLFMECQNCSRRSRNLTQFWLLVKTCCFWGCEANTFLKIIRCFRHFTRLEKSFNICDLATVWQLYEKWIILIEIYKVFYFRTTHFIYLFFSLCWSEKIILPLW